jgi:hypothetical protein
LETGGCGGAYNYLKSPQFPFFTGRLEISIADLFLVEKEIEALSEVLP